MRSDLKWRAQGCAGLGCGMGCLGAVVWVLYLIAASTYVGMNSSAVERQFAREGFRLSNYSADYHSMTLAPLAPADFDNAALEQLVGLAREHNVNEGGLSLNLDDCPKLTNVDALGAVPSGLSSLSMNNCKNLANLDGLKNQQHVRDLKLNGCEKLKDVDALALDVELRSVELKDCAALSNINGLTNLPRLSELRLTRCISLPNLDGLPDLAHLDLAGCRHLKNVDPLARCGQLEELNLSHCLELTNVKALAALRNLSRLNLSGCSKLTDLNALSNLKGLRWLSLADSPQLTDLKVIARLPKPNPDKLVFGLVSLDAQRCSRLRDVGALRDCQSLRQIDLTGSPIIASDLASLRRALPEANISFREGQ
jgi:hypothetical protein